jgi:choline dehydrogenase-like flavoprotein
MMIPMFDADCIVIGSGPAGVSAAYPLVEAGVSVLMIDGAAVDQADGAKIEAPWQKMLGRRLEALVPEDGLQPKLRTPTSRKFAEDFSRISQIRGNGFIVVGALARGGLSRLWGGLVCEFDAGDIDKWPVPIEDLQASYEAVTQRIGVSGSNNDNMADFFGRSGNLLPPLPPGPSATRLLDRFRSGSPDPAFGLGLARNAILTRDHNDRHACDLRKDCLWGCPTGAIYDARFDLAALERRNGFRLADSALATHLARTPHGWQVGIDDGRLFAAPHVVLAAGALSTAALAIPLLPNAPPELRLLNNPVAAMPLLVPSRLGRPGSAQGYSLAQLGYRLRFGSATTDYIMGAVYEIDGLPTSSFTWRLPLSRRAGTQFFNAIAPALLVATCYFPGTYSDNTIRWARQHQRISIEVRGGSNSELLSRLREVIRQLRKIWWRLGALMLPGTSLAVPGSDVHYAGPFGMGLHTVYGTTMWGELNAVPGIYVVDGGALPTLPSKCATLTIMANADRIGRHLARQVRDRGLLATRL